MFFYLGKTFKDNYPNHTTLPNGLCLSTDDGWHLHGSTITKGYCLQNNKGNYCSFICDTETVKIAHDDTRGFPLYYDENGLSNLEDLSQRIWADANNICIQQNMNVTYDVKKLIFDKQSYTDDQVIDLIDESLHRQFKEFVNKNTLPIKIFLSGGIDSLLMWSYLDHYTQDYELVDYEYLKYTPFWIKNAKHLKSKYWAYKQIHLWDEPCVLVTGSHGDEYMMRGPACSSKLLKYLGYDILDEVTPDQYMYAYLTKPKNIEAINNSIKYTKKDCFSQCLNMMANDHQHWHIEKTLTFTPMKDLDILRLVMQSSPEQILAQAIDATISKQLVQRLDPRKLTHLAKYKNVTALIPILSKKVID
jgi:hypothetical protein